MSAADELAQALRQLAVGEEDFHLADLLIETAQRVEQHGQARLREQVQGVLGESHVTIQDRLDTILNIGRDTHQLTMAVQGEQIRQGVAITEQGAAVTALRTEFQAIGENVTGLRADVDDLKDRDAQQYQESRQDRAELRARQDHADAEIERLSARTDTAHDRIAALEARLAARPSPEKAQATYNGVQQMQIDLRRVLEHLGLTFDDDQEAAV